MTPPTLRLLSLGAGVQSTTLLILAARGDLPPLDGAIFADTGWEPRAVYAHLDRLEREIAEPAGIPIHRVNAGNIRDDALNPEHRFASMPLHVRNPDGGDGMARRQCTSEYKLKPIHRRIRALLGARPRADGVPGRVPKGRWADEWVGISTDESHRALDAKYVQYAVPSWPLLDLGLSRADCVLINEQAGFADVPKSACIGCPFHVNRQWRQMRDNDPEAWADAVDFDRAIRNDSARAIRNGQPLRGQMFLHRSRLPLDHAPVDRVTATEWASRQADILGELRAAELLSELEDREVGGCSPHFCREPVTDLAPDIASPEIGEVA